MIFLEYSEIIPDIFVGTAPVEESDFSFLKNTLKIDVILSLQTEDDLLIQGLTRSIIHRLAIMHGLTWINVPIPDFSESDLKKNILKGIAVVKKHEGKRIYVHCTMGKNRSASVVAAYLCIFHDMDHDEVIKLLREKREGAIFYEGVILYVCKNKDKFKQQILNELEKD